MLEDRGVGGGRVADAGERASPGVGPIRVVLLQSDCPQPRHAASLDGGLASVGLWPATASPTFFPGVSKTKATIRPVAKEGERSPDYRVAANGVELGAGWGKQAKDTGAEYVSVKLDDPSFTAPFYATMLAGEKGEHRLIWSR